jgi:hypothetical protein
MGGSTGEGARAVSTVIEGHMRVHHPRLQVLPATKFPRLPAHLAATAVPAGVSSLVRAAIHVADTHGLAHVGILSTNPVTVELVSCGSTRSGDTLINHWTFAGEAVWVVDHVVS